MARPSKAHAFAIWDDRNTDRVKDETTAGVRPSKEEPVLDHLDDLVEVERAPDDTICASVDGNRRDSQQSRVSTLPESTSCEDYEDIMRHIFQGPPIIRPSFMRPETVRRLQMSSPPPFDHLDHVASASQSSSPVRGEDGRYNQRSVSSHSASTSGSELDVSRYPLILLHITVLRLNLPWDLDVMREILPPETLSDVTLLRSKLTDMVLQRGILVPHPREEYDLLEERFLEALELRPERVSGDGHFRPQHQQRESTTSIATSSLTSDSGIGSSVQSLSGDFGPTAPRCETCQREVDCGGKWSIKVYAANGLMRAAAWTAAWSEMERVDVEILPRIGEEMEKELDHRQEAVEKSRREATRIHEQDLPPKATRLRRAVCDFVWHDEANSFGSAISVPDLNGKDCNIPQPHQPQTSSGLQPADEIPQIYKPAQIPLTLLVKNYMLLLAKKQDWRNIVIVFLVFATVLFALRPATVVLPMVDGLTSIDPLTTQRIGSIVSSHPESGNVAASMAADTSSTSSLEPEIGKEQALHKFYGRLGQGLNPSGNVEFEASKRAAQASKGSGSRRPPLILQAEPESFGSICPWRFPFSVESGGIDVHESH